jgi:hypothetical protein
LLCGIKLLPGPDERMQKHPKVEDCTVEFTDLWGVAVEEPGVRAPQADLESQMLDITSFPLVDDVLVEIFDKAKLPRLGGMSSGRGWSSFSTFQRCPYAWKQRYVEQRRPVLLVESPSLAIGTLIHTFLAVHYMRMMDPKYRLTPEQIYAALRGVCNPKFVEEGWRIFVGYRLFYKHEVITPLAIEYDLKDPRTGESCRYDLIAYYPEWVAGRPPGTYIVEHKSASRFDQDTLEGWVNDGEVIGEVALWQHLGLDHRFGKLRGVIVNLLGKQKDPQYHRTLVAPESWQVGQHLADLKRWEGLIQLARSTDSFPRARNGCIGRYGRCDWFDHCGGME